MNKTAPSALRIATMVAFALSCFGLLLFLWLAFGGPVPLKPEGYRFKTSFGEATQLAQEADVRISGVPVGKVKRIEPDKVNGRSDVEIEMEERYAPVRSDAKAILRQKTLLGETYVELTPGTKNARAVPEDGRLAASQVSPTVELDEIFRAFDPKTRRHFQNWMITQASAVEGRGQDLNDALGNLAPFAEDTAELVEVLNTQSGALRGTVKNTGEVFDALSERQGQLSGLIENANTVFAATSDRDQQLQELFRVLPTFSRESDQTLRRLETFAREANPLVTQLRPAARALSPALEDLQAISPDLRNLFEQLGPVITASREGLPAGQRVIDELRPLLAQADPTLRELNPILDFVGLYKRELSAFFANSTAATQARPSAGEQRYLRTTNPLNPENLAAYPRRIGTNRSNPYHLPGSFDKLRSGLEVFNAENCDNPTPTAARTTGGQDVGPELLERVRRFAFPSGTNPSAGPPCRQQGPNPGSDRPTQYPQVLPKPATPQVPSASARP